MPKAVPTPKPSVQIPQKPAPLPRWITGVNTEEASTEEVLLMAIAGPREPARSNPLAAIARAIADDLALMADTDDPHGALHRLSVRAESLAELIERA